MRILLTKRKLVSSILSVIYEFAPGCRPRNIDKIHEYILQFCNKNIIDYKESIDSSDLRLFIHNMMLNCEEFRQLNISQKLWDAGIRDADDRRNSGFGISAAVGHDSNGNVSSIYTPEEYTDFIDLDACVQHIVYTIITLDEQSEDCFLCKHSKEYQSMEPSDCEECNNCSIHPNRKCNYEPHPKALKPHNKNN